jgi:hypothetical protein
MPGYEMNMSSLMLFERARTAARMKQFYGRLLRKCRQLLALKDVYADTVVVAERRLGTQIVPINSIRGSVNKNGDFDIDFYPLKPYSENRWQRLATAVGAGDSLPPVELINIWGIYFVVDGHHRVSVARMLKQDYIDAEVTEIEVSPKTENGFTRLCYYVDRFLHNSA